MENKYLTNLDNLSLEDCLCRILSKYAVILFINNEDFQLLALDDFTTDYYFIVNDYVPKGRPFYIVDEELKRYIYEFHIKGNSDDVFRGRKQKWKL